MDRTQRRARRRHIEKLNARYVACPSCDRLWARPRVKEGDRVVCPACHDVMVTNKHRSAPRTVALMLACLVLYGVTVSFPFMRMEASGLSNEISVIDAVLVLAQNGMVTLALACTGFILLFPLARILLLLFLGIVLMVRGPTGWLHAVSFRFAQILEPWTMAEIFMIGVIVSLVKVGSLATVTLGPAFFSMTVLVMLLSIGGVSVCRDTVWSDIRKVS